MKAVSKILAGGVAIAALASAAPAAAQYYPGYPNYGNQNVLGQVLGNILGVNQYGQNDRYLIDRCAVAVQQRINQQQAYNPYGGYGSPYGYNNYAYGQGRVLGITRVDRRSSVLRVRGTATAGANAGYGYGSPYGAPYGGYGYAQPVGELTFKCDIDYRGYVRDIDLNRNTNYYGYNPYGYRR